MCLLALRSRFSAIALRYGYSYLYELCWLQLAEVASMIQAYKVLQERYRLLHPLKQTAGRHTWLAEDLTHPSARTVIVKLLAFADPINWEALKLFEREAKILQNLSHPYIPQYLDSFSMEDRFLWFGLVHEFIPGTSLKDLLEQGKRFSEKSVCQLAAEVLQILIYLHELSPPVLHRDIKPSNLIWADDGHVYLIDFGTVQDKAAIEGATFTVVGTYGYTPMEQFGGRTVSSSDLYALGATLIHLLTGISPADLPQNKLRIQFADKTSLRPALVRWIGKMTEPDMAYRFDTARLALTSLHWILQSAESSTATLPVSLSGTETPIPSSPVADILGSLPFPAAPAIVQDSARKGTETPTPSPPPVTETLETLLFPGVPEIVQASADKPVEIHRSPKALEIRIPCKSSVPLGVPLVFILLVTIFVLLRQGAFAAIVTLCLCGLFLWSFIVEGATSVIQLTPRHFSRSKELRIFSSLHQQLLDQAPTAAIQDVAHWHVGTLQTKTKDVVAIKTEYQTYFVGQSGTTGETLTYDECIWLAQEIRAWLGLDRNV